MDELLTPTKTIPYFCCMRKLFFLWLIAFSAFGSSCKIVEPKVTGVRAFSLAEDPYGNRALRMDIRIDNPNRIGFRVSDPVFEVFLNSSRIAAGYSGKPVKVKARSSDFHTVYLSTDIKNIKDALGPLMSIISTGKINVKVQGDLTARVFLFKKTLRVDVSENLNVLDLLK